MAELMPIEPGTKVQQMSPNKEWIWNGSTWVQRANTRQPNNTNLRSGINTVAAGITPENLLGGVQKGDSAFAAAEREKARLNREEIQARAQRDAQRGYQIASRDQRVEGDKDAAASAAAQFNQGMAQTSAAAGGGAAVLANQRIIDPTQRYDVHMGRADTQHERGIASQEGAESAALAGITGAQTADEINRIERQRAQANAARRAAALNTNPGADSVSSGQQQGAKAPTTETPADQTQAVRRIDKAFEGAPPESQADQDALRPKLIAAIMQQDAKVGIDEWDNAVKEWNAKYPNNLIATSQSRPGQDPRFTQGNIEGALQFNEAETRTEAGTQPQSDTRVKNIIKVISRRF